MAKLKSEKSRSMRHRAFLLPGLIMFAIVALYPLVYTLLLSFSRSSLGQPFQEFSLLNYKAYFTQPLFLNSVVLSIVFALASALIAVICGLFVAYSLDAAVRTGSFVRVLLLLPLMTPPVMVGVAWKIILDPVGGLFNNIFRIFDPTMSPVLFLGESPNAMISLILVDAWQWTPLCTLLIYAAMKSIPGEVFEAAKIDGASTQQAFFRITLPLSLASIVTVFLLKLVISFKAFDLVFIMTGGGPGLDTTIASYQIYRTSLQDYNIGLGSAQVIIFIVLLSIVITPIAMARLKLISREG